MVKMVKLDGWRCERCGHEWLPRDKAKEPKVCPKCKSPYWGEPRKESTDESPAVIKELAALQIKIGSISRNNSMYLPLNDEFEETLENLKSILSVEYHDQIENMIQDEIARQQNKN